MPNSRYLAAIVTGLVLALGTVLLLSAVRIHTQMSLTVHLHQHRRLCEAVMHATCGAHLRLPREVHMCRPAASAYPPEVLVYLGIRSTRRLGTDGLRVYRDSYRPHHPWSAY